MKHVARALLVLLAVTAVVGVIAAYAVISRGLSTQVAPSAVEEVLARAMRYVATPAAVRSRRNPVEPTQAVLEEGLEHFADHCALCHGNDGSGDTAIGRNLYPPAPDMREAATQNLSDGELFSIIDNGIRLTGMPAWGTGTPEGENATWSLVHFVRRLPDLTAEEITRMEALNPKTLSNFVRKRRFGASSQARTWRLKTLDPQIAHTIDVRGNCNDIPTAKISSLRGSEPFSTHLREGPGDGRSRGRARTV